MTTDRDQFAQPPIYAREKAPRGLTVTIVRGDSQVDLAAVISAVLIVRIGVRDYRWAADIVSQRPDRVVLRHTFDAVGDETSEPGRYRIIPELRVSGGSVRARAFYFAVLP